MYSFPIGVMVESFRTDIRSAVEAAARVGASGLQLYCSRGDFTPAKMTNERIRELLDLVKSHGLAFSAICGDLSHGFGDAEKNPELIAESKRIIELAKRLETNIVTTHIGVVPTDPTNDRYKIMQEACYELAHFADGIGSRFAVETGPETSLVLKEFLDSLGSKGVSVNLDPANLVMVTGDDPVQAVYNLRDYIVHTHAKDGVKLGECIPEYVYGVLHPVPEEFRGVRLFREVPLGTGSVDFKAYLAALDDIGYRGYLTIEREVGDDPFGDISLAADFLRKTISEANGK